MIAKIVIDIPSSNVDYQYEYSVPETMIANIQIGARVIVPFGEANRHLMGYVLKIIDSSDYQGEIKEIITLVDYEPYLSTIHLELAYFIQKTTISLLIRILNIMIPDALHLVNQKKYIINNYEHLDADLALVFGGKTIVKATKEIDKYYLKIKKAVGQGLIDISYEARPKINPRSVKKYFLSEANYYSFLTELKEEDRYSLSLLIGLEPMPIVDVMEKADLSIYKVKKFIKRGYLDEIKEPISYIKNRNINIDYKKIDIDTFNQDYFNLFWDAYYKNEKIIWVPQNNNEILVGLVKIIMHNYQKNFKTLIICPNILTSFKYADLIKKYTKLDVACINSQINNEEIWETYLKIQQNNIPIIITTNKGSLYNYEAIGSIVVINSENDSFYNDQSPRYDLKRVMEKYSELIKCPLIFQTFTPTVEEYTMAIQKSYYIFDNRQNKNKNVLVVDMKDELRLGNNTSISTLLLNKIKNNNSLKRITLLIINNKGYSNYLICRSCGHVIKCPKCELSLQYHKKNNVLRCPACSYQVNYSNQCPVCSSDQLLLMGSGMEQVEETITLNISNINIVKIDNSNYDQYCEKMELLEANEVDIVITTDTYAQAVINQNIETVGIINIDNIAKSSRYDANQKAYELLENTNLYLQESGQVIIQTMDPNAKYLQLFINNNYNEFMKNEIKVRNTLKIEPFYHVNRIFVKGDFNQVFKEADNIKKALWHQFNKDVFVIGPTYNHKYRAVQVIIKHRIEDINDYYQVIYRHYQNAKVNVIFDLYPKYL